MEKVVKAKNKFLMLLPKAAISAVTFQNPPFSPSREKRLENANKLKTHTGKGYSAPIRSIIPAETRRRKSSKNSIFEPQDQEEPTSPKISCMGQIKHKHNDKHNHNHRKKKIINKIPKKSLSMPKNIKPISTSSYSPPLEEPKGKKKSAIGRMFGGRKSDVTACDHQSQLSAVRAPSLSHMKRFASSRDHKLSNFDWTAQIAPVESDHRNYYSDHEESEGEEGEEEEGRIPFSAPILVNSNGINGSGGEKIAIEPRKEVNLWKRRTMDPPKPLHLNPLFISK